MNQAKIEFRKVRDFGALLNVTFDYIRNNFKLLFKSNLLIASPFILLSGVFMGIYQSSMFSFAYDQGFEAIGIPFLLAMVFMIVSYLIITEVTYSHLMLYKQSESGVFELEDVWQMVKKNFFMILLTGIGYSFIVGFGFLFLIIPGIYLSIALSLIFIVRLEEELGFFDAVSRCIKLIKNNWWFTFGLILVVGIIQGFLMYALYIPNYIMMFATAFAGVDSEASGLNRILYIFTSIISSLGTLLYTVSTIAIAFHYYNLVERKEAPGLLAQIDEIK
ncbi:MAG: hypothetical protein HXY48_08990 [Ignavibacteriaceae bacterium]|nr:hypothetical protein [Ignavibacteriaceae bacterium]